MFFALVDVSSTFRDFEPAFFHEKISKKSDADMYMYIYIYM